MQLNVIHTFLKLLLNDKDAIEYSASIYSFVLLDSLQLDANQSAHLHGYMKVESDVGDHKTA
jgi:hypothetical protein